MNRVATNLVDPKRSIVYHFDDLSKIELKMSQSKANIKPYTINLAIYGMWVQILCLVLSTVFSIAEDGGFMQSTEQLARQIGGKQAVTLMFGLLITLNLFYVCMYFVFKKAFSSGKNWARLLFSFLSIVTIPFELIGLILSEVGVRSYWFTFGFVVSTIFCMVMLFSSRSNKWFNGVYVHSKADEVFERIAE